MPSLHSGGRGPRAMEWNPGHCAGRSTRGRHQAVGHETDRTAGHLHLAPCVQVPPSWKSFQVETSNVLGRYPQSNELTRGPPGRVSFETSFNSKQLKLGTIRNKMFVSVVSLLYWNREFRCFNWTETNRRPTHTVKIESIWIFFRKFRACFGLLRFVTKQICLFWGCFDIGSKHRNKPKFFVFGFTKQTETNRNKRKTDIVSFCFGSNRNLFLFVSRTPPELVQHFRF